jgi:hypothetical protein
MPNIILTVGSIYCNNNKIIFIFILLAPGTEQPGKVVSTPASYFGDPE